jgi:hypothetical protein
MLLHTLYSIGNIEKLQFFEMSYCSRKSSFIEVHTKICYDKNAGH